MKKQIKNLVSAITLILLSQSIVIGQELFEVNSLPLSEETIAPKLSIRIYPGFHLCRSCPENQGNGH
jgi:hypothetical protein